MLSANDYIKTKFKLLMIESCSIALFGFCRVLKIKFCE